MSPFSKIDHPGRSDLLDLTDADALAVFFDRLGYTTDRLEQVPENLGIVAESTRRPVRGIERIVRHGEVFLPRFEVYLFELSKITLTHTRALVKAFRDRVGFFLLVLTSDWQRLDFVYVERTVPESGSGAPSSLRGQERVRLRPRILTVDRRKPHRVALRVLRRLRWTSQDTIAQDQKVLSAYSVADWSEELFNNRALFSDHYLKRSLPTDVSWSDDDPKPVLRELVRAFQDGDDRFSGKSVAELRAGLLGPVLRTLGFRFTDSGSSEPPTGRKRDGFRLYAPDAAPAAVFLDCPWGRFLDGKDPTLDSEAPEDNPGIRVVQAFEPSQGAEPIDWVILTNGRLWRLYGRRAHSRATNYYEIDLPELLVPGDAEQALDAFRYFWLIFRCGSFERRPQMREGREVREALVDRVLIDSQEYAKELGERLKETVFEEVFPDLAQAFLRSLARGEELFSQTDLDAAFRGTLAFLYRALFLLYAEARDLLPVHEVHDYLEISLKRIREEIAEAGGAALSERDRRLAKRYGLETFTLYERLRHLFRVIDQGDPAVNVPSYNGGLFISVPEDEDQRAEAEAARFLSRARVDDFTLACALDRLARAEETKRTELMFIDYRSLGVRQLGSIYEGLLEFRLRVAREEMAVVAEKKGSGKKSEKVIALGEARKSKNVTILRAGRAKEAAERILRPGDVYLENDKGERKTTGSYYTPDFVVEYLVAKTLGPILEEKLDTMRPALRKAQKWQRKMVRMAEQKGEPRQKYITGPAVDGEWEKLVEDFFDVKVLDPAMGSGHFLVEAVDFITDKMLEFLGKFPWNPILAYLESTRREIIAEMEKLEIMIPEERLTDVNLLKRHVLKRCIYGVDVNPMAVELAKVSLWLDCFTLGAPLSFLDHHLRCGNSLLGVTIDEVREEVEGKVGEASAQMALFTSRFAAIKLATAAMAAVGAMPDVTSEQIRKSRSSYRSATNALAQFHRLLDVWCSRWFVKPPTVVSVNGPVAVEKKERSVTERVRQYLRADALESYFKAESEEEISRELAKLEAVDREYLEAVAAEATTRGFFHWEIEFPEVFYQKRPGTDRQMERAYGREFDAVVGNPPWVRQESLKEIKPALKEIFAETFAAEADIYVFLVARALEVLGHGGRFGMILQNKWFKTEYAGKFREFLRERTRPLEVVDFGHAPLFPDADTFPCTLLLLKPGKDVASYDSVDFFDVDRRDLPGIDLHQYGARIRTAVPRERLRKSGWELLPKPVGDLMEKIRRAGVPLREFVGSSPLYGIKTGLNEAFLIDQATRDRLVEKDPRCEEVIKPFLRGENVRRWHSPWDGEWMILLKSSRNHDWPWSSSADTNEAEKIFRKEFPSLHDWMTRDEGREKKLRKREDQGRFWWELRSCDYYHQFEQSKIIYQEIQFHSRFSLDDSKMYCMNKIFFLPSSAFSLVAILNSSMMWWYLERHVGHMKDEAYAMQRFKIKTLPILPPGEQTKSLDTRSERLTRRTETLHVEEALLSETLTELLDAAIATSKIEDCWRHDERSFLDLVRRLRKRALTSAEKKTVSSAFLESRLQLRTLRREICELEIALHHEVFDLYGLTREEVALLRKTAPPRDPLAIVEADLRLLDDD